MKTEATCTHPGLSATPPKEGIRKSGSPPLEGTQGWIHWITLALVFCVSCLGTCTARAETNATAPDALAPLRNQNFLFEVARHLYRWTLDESDIDKAPQSGPVQFWIHPLTPKLDPGDQSIFAELIVPLFRVSVSVKDTDYTIEELGVRVNSSSYKITNVERITLPAEPPKGWEVVTVEMKDMRDYLFRTRALREFPTPELKRRMAIALFDQMDDFTEIVKQPEQIVFWSPLSPVANEVWVFWETGRMLIRFSSDIDLANPAVWEHDELSTKSYDVDKQVVVSLSEAPGSNRFMTRDQIGRALFNCVILGEKKVSPTETLRKELEEAGKIQAAAPAVK